MNIKELQEKLPWTVPYSEAFEQSMDETSYFRHAMLHIGKSTGLINEYLESYDHRPSQPAISLHHQVADLVICALRMANTCPGGKFDLEKTIIRRLETKNKVKLDAV